MKKFLRTRFWSIILIICAIFYIQHATKQKTKERADFALTGGYAIGVYNFYIATKTLKSVKYTYTINSKEISRYDPNVNLDPFKVDAFFHSQEGDKFLVLYDKNDPEESIIRLDYPIKDSTDFKRYVREFELMRQQKRKK